MSHSSFVLDILTKLSTHPEASATSLRVYQQQLAHEIAQQGIEVAEFLHYVVKKLTPLIDAQQKRLNTTPVVDAPSPEGVVHAEATFPLSAVKENPRNDQHHDPSDHPSSALPHHASPTKKETYYAP